MSRNQRLPDDFSRSQILDDGLVLRLATPADVEALCHFTEEVFYPNLAISVREMMAAREAQAMDCDFAIVIDEKVRQVVAAAGLSSLQWHYATELLDVGLIEVVGTLKAYRQRGLSEKVMAHCHALSAARGHHLQVAMGLAWYYRKYGYEYALAGLEDFVVPLSPLPAATEAFEIRESISADIPQLLQLYQGQCADKLVTQHRDEDFLAYHVGNQLQGALGLKFHTVLDGDGTLVGYLGTWADKPYGRIILRELGAVDEALFLPITHAILRHMKAYVDANQEQFGDEVPTEVFFTIGKNHPATRAIQEDTTVFKESHWYIRIPNLVNFLQQIQAVLEQRLAGSSLKDYTGNLNISFYTDGISLEFDTGRINCIEGWQPTALGYRSAAFPFRTFSKLIFGYRSLAEIQYMYPDCRVDDETTALLNILFPKQASWAMY